jgi:hypothetical protein
VNAEPDTITAQISAISTIKAMNNRPPTKKLLVLSRESLPGTWKEVEDEKVLIFSTTAKQRPSARVSILDMTDA